MNNHTMECMAIHVDASIRGEHVAGVMETLCAQCGDPVCISMDNNGPEFISEVLDKWACEHKVPLNFSRQGKPTDNDHIESFDGRCREECLTAKWFLSPEDARNKIEAWRRDHDEVRTHSALDWLAPSEYARQARGCSKSVLSRQPDFSMWRGPDSGAGSQGVALVKAALLACGTCITSFLCVSSHRRI
jgi:putative transposase